jgi:hypothetical protein
VCWYVKRFPDGQIQLRPHGGLLEFAEVFEVFARTRSGAAVFSVRDADGGVSIYFPPVAAEFARMIRASEVDKPCCDGLVPLLGDREAFESWFGAQPARIARPKALRR